MLTTDAVALAGWVCAPGLRFLCTLQDGSWPHSQLTDHRSCSLRSEQCSQQTQSLSRAGFEPVVYDEVHVEPTSTTFMHAAKFVKDEGPFAAICSLGGGSSMDTAKAAILYSCHPPPEVRVCVCVCVCARVCVRVCLSVCPCACCGRHTHKIR